jgi:sugar-specific transcriptional regulator TrmB
MEKEQLLEKIGLSKEEGKIYLALLGSKPETVSGIAKLSGLYRPVIYKLLPGLIEKGLVVKVVHGKHNHFSAESPERLETLLDVVAKNIKQAIPELMNSFASCNTKPVIKFLEGHKGIESVFDDLVRSLKKGDIFYRYSSGRDVKRNERYLPERYREMRDQKQLERFVITNESTASAKKPRLERGIKIIPRKYGFFDYDITEIIYGNNVAFIDYNTETALVIENKVIFEFHKNLFKILYDML